MSDEPDHIKRKIKKRDDLLRDIHDWMTWTGPHGVHVQNLQKRIANLLHIKSEEEDEEEE